MSRTRPFRKVESLKEGTPLRRTMTLCIAVAAALGLASVAQAAETTTLKVSLSPAKAKAGSKLTVFYTSKSDQPFETAPYQTHFDFFFARGMSFPYAAFPKCKIPPSAIVPAKCRAAKVGPGKADNDGRVQDLHHVPATLNLYSGGPPGILYFPAIVTQPAQVNVFIKGTLKRASGAYGFHLDVPLKIPTILPDVMKPFVNSFKIGPVGKTVVKHGRKIFFINNPPKCTRKGWPFKLVTTYNNGDTSTATATVRCTR
jgi:hypothetical protein